MTNTSKRGVPNVSTTKKQELVLQYLRLYGTNSPTKLQSLIKSKEKVNIARETIKKYVDQIKADNQEWVHGQAKFQFMETVREFSIDTKLEIKQLQNLLNKLLSESSATIPSELLEMLRDYEDDKVSKKILAKLRKQMSGADKLAGKIAYINSVITEKRNSLLNMVTDIPLYQQTQMLSDFYDDNQPDEIQ